MKCQNQHKMIIDWEGGLISDRPCVNEATSWIIDSFGTLFLCNECYEDDFKRILNSENLTIEKTQDAT